MRFLSHFRQSGALTLLALLSLFAIGAPASAATLAVNVTVDFAQSTPQKNLSGFLNGMNGSSPQDSLLQPLKPAFWRLRAGGDPATYNRAVKQGAHVELSLSGSYGYPLNNWCGKGAPWLNHWANWEAHVHKMAQRYRDTPNVYWDVWNEPDSFSWNATQFWNGTQAQFFETYKRAYTILRQELGPDAIIGGPSYANYEPANLTAFLNYCHQNKLQVNFLSWHELMRAELDIPSIPQHIKAMRQLAATMPNLKMQKILINEAVGPVTQYSPGDILGFLYYMELGGADGANKACWNDSHGSNNCFNNSLDGIVDPDNGQPRASWWAYKTYADSIGSRVKTTTNHPNLVVMASKTPSQILLGYLGTSATGPAGVTLNIHHLELIGQSGSTVKVSISKVPNSGEAPLTRLVQVRTTTLPVKSGSATFQVPAINLHEEYVITLTP